MINFQYRRVYNKLHFFPLSSSIFWGKRSTHVSAIKVTPVAPPTLLLQQSLEPNEMQKKLTIHTLRGERVLCPLFPVFFAIS